jgi:hypothetical protein
MNDLNPGLTAQPRNSAGNSFVALRRIFPPAVFPEGSGLLPGQCGKLPRLRGNLRHVPASLPDDRGKLRDRRGRVPAHSGKLLNFPGRIPNRPDKLLDAPASFPNGSGKLPEGCGKPKNLKKPLFPAIHAISLTRPSATLAHPMGEQRGEGVFLIN